MAVPVDGGELGDGAGVGAQDVDGGAEGTGVHRGGGGGHGGWASGAVSAGQYTHLARTDSGSTAPRGPDLARQIAAHRVGAAESAASMIGAVMEPAVDHFNVLHVVADSLEERFEQMRMFRKKSSRRSGRRHRGVPLAHLRNRGG